MILLAGVSTTACPQRLVSAWKKLLALAWRTGLNQSNLLAIAANGDTISVYVNGQFVASVQDKTYSNGQIGIYAYGDTGCDVAVSNVRVWKL